MQPQSACRRTNHPTKLIPVIAGVPYNVSAPPRQPVAWRYRLLVRVANLHRRMMATWFVLAGPRVAYALTGFLARRMYRMLEPLRQRSEAQCRAALGGRVADGGIPRIAEQAFVHRVWNLADLALADRLLHPAAWRRYGGVIEEPWRSRVLDAQRRGQPAILLTGYYGPFDLLPLFLGFNGVRAAAVYLPHANPDFDAYRQRIRARGGCRMVPVSRGPDEIAQVLEAGGTLALIADHHAGRRGIPVTFLGLPTLALKSVGLLAWRYEADVVVAGIRRVGDEFRFEVPVADVIDHSEWQGEADPIRYITERYLRGLERIILADPTQYIWAYPRWGEEFARQAAQSLSPSEP